VSASTWRRVANLQPGDEIIQSESGITGTVTKVKHARKAETVTVKLDGDRSFTVHRDKGVRVSVQSV
jgi:preprotein translocase subunit YajC